MAWSSGSGRLWTQVDRPVPQHNNGAVTMKIINNTNITSTNGVTFISLIGSFSSDLI